MGDLIVYLVEETRVAQRTALAVLPLGEERRPKVTLDHLPRGS